MYEDDKRQSTFTASGSVDSHLSVDSLKQRRSIVPYGEHGLTTNGHTSGRRSAFFFGGEGNGNDVADAEAGTHYSGAFDVPVPRSHKITPSSYRGPPNGPRSPPTKPSPAFTSVIPPTQFGSESPSSRYSHVAPGAVHQRSISGQGSTADSSHQIGNISLSTSVSTTSRATSFMSARTSLATSEPVGLGYLQEAEETDVPAPLHFSSPSSSSSSSSRRTSPNIDRDLPSPPPPEGSLLVPPTIPPNDAAATNGLLRTPKTQSSKHFDSPSIVTPGSNVSLVPSEGEENDSFHVRHTYAVLDTCGVKGDGYEEGVERTRAKIGPSRQSQLNAADAIANGEEKTRDLSAKELSMLASLDRYGFYSVPSHDRLVLLPSAPLLKRLAPVRAGPPTSSPSAKSLSSIPPTPPPLREASRIAKWTRMVVPASRDQGGNIESWMVKPSKAKKLRERTYKGIPDRWRSAAWELLVEKHAGRGGGDREVLSRAYRDALDKPSTYDIQIDLDVPRTINGHIMFKTRYGAGQRSLFHVLHCFSQRCETCGYVQGMGPIAATLLCYLSPSSVYTTLVRLHDAYSLHSIFSPGFPGLLEAIYVQERLMESTMPDVYQAFKKHMISTTSYATKWYITLFANSVPFQTQLRLWDAFLLDGPDVFVGVAVAIVWTYRDQLTSSSASFETILSLLSSFFVPEDENVFIGWIGNVLGDKSVKANIKRWRVEWGELVKTGKDTTALL
jgi:hypothetical protein